MKWTKMKLLLAILGLAACDRGSLPTAPAPDAAAPSAATDKCGCAYSASIQQDSPYYYAERDTEWRVALRFVTNNPGKVDCIDWEYEYLGAWRSDWFWGYEIATPDGNLPPSSPVHYNVRCRVRFTNGSVLTTNVLRVGTSDVDVPSPFPAYGIGTNYGFCNLTGINICYCDSTSSDGPPLNS
jgi:hypothetical protein